MSSLVDEILEKSEDEPIFFEWDRLKCDLTLAALQKIQDELDNVNKLADDEVKMIEEYRTKELERLSKKMSWLSKFLEDYTRQSGEKTIKLPHGIMKLRQGRDKVEIENEAEFMKVAKEKGLTRTKPSKEEPDLVAILEFVKKHKRIPSGIKFIPATTNFSYTLNTKGGNNGNGEEELQAEG
jgi:phage host-nuclease inhibitor protein Gam